MQLGDKYIKPIGSVLCGQINQMDDLLYAIEHILDDAPDSLKPCWLDRSWVKDNNGNNVIV